MTKVVVRCVFQVICVMKDQVLLKAQTKYKKHQETLLWKLLLFTHRRRCWKRRVTSFYGTPTAASCRSVTEGGTRGLLIVFVTFVCATLIFILRSNGDQGRLSRATDPYFISSVKSNRGLLLSSCFVQRLDIYKAIAKTQSQLNSGTSTGVRC